MYNDNIYTYGHEAQKYLLKQAHSHIDLLGHQKFSLLSKKYGSTRPLPILLKEKTSFAQFITDEKYKLQVFRLLKERKIVDKQKDKKKLIRNFHLPPFDMPNNNYSTLTNLKILDDEKTPTYVIHSSNFAVSRLSNRTIAKSAKPIKDILAHKAIGIIDINRKRHMRCVERHINYMNNEQRKAALCFILQLNTYFNQKMLPLKNESNKMNEDYVHSKKLDVSPKKIIELDMNAISTLDFLSKSNSNDTHLAETKDSIDISMQLSDNLDSSSKLISKKNDDLLADVSHPIKMLNETPTKYEKCIMNSPSKFNDGMTINISKPKITHVRDISTIPLQRIQTPMKSIENIEMKNSTLNRTEINIHQQSTMLNSSLTNNNYHISESSIDLGNLLNESIKKKSSFSFHSRCLVSFEFVNQEEYLVEVIELPRSFHRISRMDMYKKIQQRLVLMTLIDIDLTGLLRTVFQSFP